MLNAFASHKQAFTFNTPQTTDFVGFASSVPIFAASLGITVNGSASYTVQYSVSDTKVPGSMNWFSDSANTNNSASKFIPLTGPITAVRLVINAVVGSVVLESLQYF